MGHAWLQFPGCAIAASPNDGGGDRRRVATDDSPILEAIHDLRVADNVHVVADDQGRGAGVDSPEVRHQLAHGGPIEMNGGFVKNEHLWLACQSTGDGDALALPSGQQHPALADKRFIPAGKAWMNSSAVAMRAASATRSGERSGLRDV